MSASIPTIGYRDRTDHPWPRILWFIAIITVVYGAGRIGMTIPVAEYLWTGTFKYSGIAIGREYFLTAIDAFFEVIIGLLLIIGAAHLIRGGSQRLILAGHWASVGLWVVVVIAESALGRGGVTFWGLFNLMLLGVHMNICPIMVILILRARHAR